MLRARVAWLVACACTALPAIASAQEGEVILDPELSDLPPPPPPEPVSAEPNGEFRVQLRSRVGVDLVRDDPREDVWEFTELAVLEAKVRRSEHLRFALGVRIRYLYATREADTSDANAERYALDVTPTAAYGDATLSDGLHLRIGYQGVALGNFDLLNVTDVLSVYDLRSGPTTPEEAFDIAQLAVRVDWDLSSVASLTAIYVPFFMTHRFSVFDGDYALFPNAPPYNPESGLTEDVQGAEMLRQNLTRSAQANLSDAAFAAFTPDSDFNQPQAAVHLGFHGAAGQLGFTAAIARDQIPAFEPPSTTVTYEQFELLAVEALTDVGPIQLGGELGYMFGRTLFTTLPGPVPPTGETDLFHAALRLNYTKGEDFILVIEAAAERAQADAAAATAVPDARWLWLAGERWWFMVAGFASLAVGEATFRFGGTLLNGPSYVLSPQADIELLDGFFAEIGAYVVGEFGSDGAVSAGVVPGGLYDKVDQVFIGLRWIP
jgi:hypothetical protein